MKNDQFLKLMKKEIDKELIDQGLENNEENRFLIMKSILDHLVQEKVLIGYRFENNELVLENNVVQ